MKHIIKERIMVRSFAKKISIFFRYFFLFLAAVQGVSTLYAAPQAPTEINPSDSSVIVNRALLTVNRNIFSAVDAIGMLMIWNMTKQGNENQMKLETDWLKPLPLGETARLDPTVMMKQWPADVKVFFQIALIWSDVQKLNLFVIREQEVDENLKKFKLQFESLSKGIPIVLAREVFATSDSTKKKWIESVLRTGSFLRVRGNLERNKNLFNVSWFWHKMYPYNEN